MVLENLRNFKMEKISVFSSFDRHENLEGMCISLKSEKMGGFRCVTRYTRKNS